jgi:hypothetical protein
MRRLKVEHKLELAMASTLDIFPTTPVDVVIMAAGKGTRMKSIRWLQVNLT